MTVLDEGASKEWWQSLLIEYQDQPLIWNSNIKYKKAMQAMKCDTVAPHDSKCFCIMDNINRHDSSWSTIGHGQRNNNPCNMRPPKTWTPSVPFTKTSSNFAKFKTLEDGITACTELYTHWYSDLDHATLTGRWTNNEAPTDYEDAIEACYNI